ncbi:hypothetical protein CHLRE_06g303850v5 [Chlamydomonas reinhardtii]|uniref:Uncharacterized protein n=1 Tax=Chlamydomonas reinhardtii TaxID=3055 RepID=A0A2K3DR53_CHLRE|nr:uncharacterized protein CHLRE_06g303850v5 [Chlamydomonas reinhardtii]PNW83032.1 hypothetical protein CHLRE_06g303850v5 [Chlamydomonas reinhardtii]7PKT_N Chain N, mL114 [Chlamydomonas reinhardtii]
MRRAVARCTAQIAAEACSVSSACSTSGRQVQEQLDNCLRWMTYARPRSRIDYYDPTRNVYKEFQRKWDRANAAAAAAASQAEAAAARPSHSAPPSAAPQQQPYGGAGSYPFGSSLTTPCSSYGSGYGAGYGGTAAAGADWPPGYEALLQTYLEQELPLSAEEASTLVAAAKKGLLPGSRSLIRTRFMHIKDLEPRFPGFDARAAVLGEPRLLRHAADKVMRAMLVFQDHWPSHPVGPLMGRIGCPVIRDPAGVGHRLYALTRALKTDLHYELDPHRLTPESEGFLASGVSPFELEARVSALVTIFGREGAGRLLDVSLDVLTYAPRDLDRAVLALREVFSAAGDRGYGRHSLSTPEGAAAAAADRGYVTDLAVAWPGVLALPGRLGGADGVARLLARVRRAGGARYRGAVGRRALLSEVLERPELLQAAAEAAMRGEEEDEEEDVEGRAELEGKV